MRFTDHRFKPGLHRWKYLQYLDEVAPEVKESLIQLCPKFRAVENGYALPDSVASWLSRETADQERGIDDLLRELSVRKRHKVVDRSRVKKEEQRVLGELYELRKGFDDVIDEYQLKTVEGWLRRNLFYWLGQYSGEPHLYKQLALAHLQAWIPKQREKVEFTFDGWGVEDSSEEFIARLTKNFNRFVDDHIKKMASKYKAQGYMLTTKPFDVTWVKWLVYWNVKRMPKDDILDLITIEDLTGNRVITIKTLNSHFRRFKDEFDLPLRVG